MPGLRLLFSWVFRVNVGDVWDPCWLTGRHLEEARGTLNSPLAVLGDPVGPWGRPWEVLGWPKRVLGRSLGVLGGSLVTPWGTLWETKCALSAQWYPWRNRGGPWERFGGSREVLGDFLGNPLGDHLCPERAIRQPAQPGEFENGTR